MVSSISFICYADVGKPCHYFTVIISGFFPANENEKTAPERSPQCATEISG